MALAGIAPILHIVGALLAIIELGLTAYVASAFNAAVWGIAGYSRSPDVINFLIFASIWSLLVLAYLALTPRYSPKLHHALGAFVINAVTAIFWFSGAIAEALYASGGTCYGNRVCGSAKAAIAFAFFLWVLFTILAVIDGLANFGSRRHSETSAGTTTHGAKHGHTKAYPGV